MTLAALLLLGPAAAWAQDAPDEPAAGTPPDDTTVILPSGQPVEGEIDALTTRIRALEEQLDALQAQDSVDANELPIDLETKVQLFADANMRAFNVNHPPGFELGDLVLSYTGNLNRRMFATADVIYGRNQFDETTVFLDRVKIDLRIHDSFNVSVGKMESPFGYWNPEIMYGAYRYTTISRPVMLTFERFGAFITTRQTGVDIHGTFAPGFWQIGYHAGIGNGRSAQLSSTQDIGDATIFKAMWGQVWVQTPGGVQVGMTVGYDPIRENRPTLDFNQDQGDQSTQLPRIENDATNPLLTSNTDEIQLHPHIAIEGAKMSLIAEGAVLFHRTYINVLNEEPGGSSIGGYVQWTGTIGRFTTPYARVDHVQWSADDPLFVDLRKNKTRSQFTVGFRQEMGLRAAFKLEGTYIDETVFRTDRDPLFVPEEEDIFVEGINDINRDRFGIAAQVAVGF